MIVILYTMHIKNEEKNSLCLTSFIIEALYLSSSLYKMAWSLFYIIKFIITCIIILKSIINIKTMYSIIFKINI